ncbi:unnamed protein product [Symbiodinium sp. CCMP2592]|nr:unnamed protein product [Symbiodinium sp. CCMP2592]CAE7818418.1 unnamed protein product [Symbiodinium sp. CCMP2592]
MAGGPPPDPRVHPCQEVPHESHLELRWLQKRAKGVLHHKLTGEMVPLPEGATDLHFDVNGRAFLKGPGLSSVWATTVLKHHVFKVQTEQTERCFVLTKTSTGGVQLEWLDVFRKSYKLLYPQDALRGVFADKHLVLMWYQYVPEGENKCFWQLLGLSRLPRKDLLKQLRKSWLPAFEARRNAAEAPQARDIIWPNTTSEEQDSTKSYAHDAFASSRFVVFLMVLLAKHYEEPVVFLRSLLKLLLPGEHTLRVNRQRQKLDLVNGKIDLSQICQRSIFKARQDRPLPRSLRRPFSVQHCLIKLFHLKSFRWLVWDIVTSLGSILDLGVACRSFPSGPSEQDTFSLEQADHRDPNMREMRMKAALGKAWNANKRKAADKKAKLTSAAKTKLRMQAEASRRFCVARQKKKERGQYLESARRTFSASRFLHVAMDGGRAGGRKRWLYCVLDAVSQIGAWAPPLRFKDSGYRLPDADKVPCASEQQRLDANSLRFLDSLRAVESGPSKAVEPVVKKATRHASYEQLVGLNQTLKSMFPALEKGLLSFRRTETAGSQDLRSLPTLIVTSDAGPDLQSGLQFLQNGLGIRAVCFWEGRHMLSRELENALTHIEHMKPAMIISEMILNFSRGPWQGHRWFREECVDFLSILEAAGTPESSALLHFFHPRVARDLGVSEASLCMSQVMDEVRQASFLQKRGPANISRWDTFHSGWEERRPEMSLLCMLLVSFGVKMGFLGKAKATLEGPSGAGTAAEDEPVTMSGESRAKLWARCKNKLHCVATALLNTDLRFDLDAWFFLSKPQSQALHDLRNLAKVGPSETLKIHLREASGEPLTICDRILQQMFSPEVWAFLDLWCSGSLHGGYVQRMAGDHPECRLQSARMARMLEMTLALLHQKLLYASVPLFSYPYRLVLLVSPDRAIAEATVLQLKRCWEADQVARRTNSRWCKGFAKRSPFSLSIMQDVVLAFQRTDWSLSEEVKQWALRVFSGFGATWNEEGFSKARQREGAENKSHEMSDHDLWQTLSLNGVLRAAGVEEVRGRDDTSGIVWPGSLFHIQRRVPEEDLRRITGNANWASMTQQSLASAACELALLCQAVEANTVRLVAKLHGEFGLAGAAFELVLPVTMETLRWAQIEKFSDWKVLPARAISPLEHFVRTRDAAESAVPLLWPTGPELAILSFAAENGYPGVPLTVLKLLMKQEFGQNMDAHEQGQIGEVLLEGINQALQCSQEKAADALEMALHHRERDTSELTEMLALPHFAEALQSKEDEKKIHDAIAESKASQRTVMSITSSIRTLRPAKKTKNPKRKPVAFRGDSKWPTEVLQPYAPQEYRVYRDDFNKCIRAYHRRYDWSISRSWGRIGQEAVPARAVLQAVWTRHEALHPAVVCPWNFQEVVR